MKKVNMKKVIFMGFCLIIAISTILVILIQNVNAAAPAVDKYGQLQVSGSKMCDSSNNPVQLRGMSFFWSNWDPGYYNADVVKWLKEDWNCNIVRASMGIDAEYGYLENPGVQKQKVFDVIDAAIAQGIYVIVDWHDHSAQEHTQQSVEFFKEVAQKYGNTPNIIYEIYNEPDNESWSVIKSYAQTVVNAIREIDNDNIIVVGTPQWSQSVNTAANDPVNGTNIMYTLHFYAGTHGQWLRDEAVSAMNKGIALFVTEWGTSEASGDGRLAINESNVWLDFLDKYKLSWCNWSVMDKLETSAALVSGANLNGGWTDGMLTDSGRYVRGKIKESNGTSSSTSVPSVAPSIATSEAPSTTSNPSTTAPTQSEGDFKVEYSANDWGSGATVTLKITNNGAAINGWTVEFSFSGNQKISNMWNAEYTQNGSEVTIKNLSYNGSIGTGQSLEIGFNISYSGSNSTPSNIVVNGN